MDINNRRTCRTPVFKKGVPDDSFKFLVPPQPTGQYPYHLDAKQVLTKDISHKMVFHMVGDTGSALQPEFQQCVVAAMINHFAEAQQPEDQPAFLYHLGDVVYHFGEAEEYYRQFFKPYDLYPSPIFAIPGNHDSDINPAARRPYQSLDAFTKVFCDRSPQTLALARAAARKTMIQPNVYWTLDTPLADIIGLYSNVPKFGTITPEQKGWFIGELKTIAAGKRDKLLVVCIHHAPYSADVNHGASREMITFLDESFDEAGIHPDIVLSGHVHNYQRFSKQVSATQMVPYIVAGAGGYATLFPIATEGDRKFSNSSPLLNHVCLDNFCDDKHGFLKMSVERHTGGITLTGEYYTIPYHCVPGTNVQADLFDKFSVTVNRGAATGPQ